MNKTIQVQVCGLAGNMKTVDLCNTEEQLQKMTVQELKNKASEKFSVGADEMEMIFMDKRLEGDNTLLGSYGIEHMSVIYLVIVVHGGMTA